MNDWIPYCPVRCRGTVDLKEMLTTVEFKGNLGEKIDAIGKSGLRSYSVRQAAATAYGALCSALCSILVSPNGRQNHVILGSLVERFISWELSLLTNVNIGYGTLVGVGHWLSGSSAFAF